MRLRGVDEMVANLKRVGNETHQKTVEAVKANVEEALDAAKSNWPVKTGALRESGRSRSKTMAARSVPRSHSADLALITPCRSTRILRRTTRLAGPNFWSAR